MLQLDFLSIADSYKMFAPELHERESNGVKISIQDSYSNFTPRKNAYMEFAPQSDERIVVNGTTQAVAFIRDLFNDTFFSKSRTHVKRRMLNKLRSHFGGNPEEHHKGFIKKMLELHSMNYLPIEFKSIKEGTRYPIGLPVITAKSTASDKFDFGWLVNYLETLASNLVWPMINCTSINEQFYLQAREFGEKSIPPEMMEFWLPYAVHNFELRGMWGPEAGTRSGACHSLFFRGTDSHCSMEYFEQYHNYRWDTDNPEDADKPIAESVNATEHADITRLLSEFRHRGITEDTEYWVAKELAENSVGIMAYVADSENYFRMLTTYGAMLRDVIENRKDRGSLENGDFQPAKFTFRPDSSRRSPLTVICGFRDHAGTNDNGFYFTDTVIANNDDFCFTDQDGKHYIVDELSCEVVGDQYRYAVEAEISTDEVNGSLNALATTFGYEELEVQGKVWKFINPKVGLIYGEAISLQHQREIYTRMEEMGFSAINFLVGKGSYAVLKGNTRDMFSISYKQTFSLATIGDETNVSLEQKKSPMGDISKTSAKGLLNVIRNGYDFEFNQECTPEEEQIGELITISRNSDLLNVPTYFDIVDQYQTDLAMSGII